MPTVVLAGCVENTRWAGWDAMLTSAVLPAQPGAAAVRVELPGLRAFAANEACDCPAGIMMVEAARASTDGVPLVSRTATPPLPAGWLSMIVPLSVLPAAIEALGRESSRVVLGAAAETLNGLLVALMM